MDLMKATETEELPNYQGELQGQGAAEFHASRRTREALQSAADRKCTQCGGRGARAAGGILTPCRCVLGRLSRMRRAV